MNAIANSTAFGINVRKIVLAHCGRNNTKYANSIPDLLYIVKAVSFK